MSSKIPDLPHALTGTYDALTPSWPSDPARLDLVEQAMAELDAFIVQACRPWQYQIDLLQTIPGAGEKVAQVIIAETGADISRFATAGRLAGWVGLVPAMNESAASRPRPESGTGTGG
jgi:transposase